ncbi:type II secretion system protein [Photobacterium minamisatsumaniensis]|uniref:type II secretion system protein n=1 Tax=Photobacterium minamisatsumaniensis TaxID=2910233 RepID=UPI003D0DA965
MQNNKGFTLIELVIVIVILGVLAVTAASKFSGIQNDAREATLDAAISAIQAADSIVLSKSITNGIDSIDNAKLNLGNGETVTTTFGHIRMHDIDIKKVVTLDGYTVLNASSEYNEVKTTLLITNRKENTKETILKSECFIAIGNSEYGELQFFVNKDNC